MMKMLKIGAVAALVVKLIVPAASADHYLKVVSETKPFKMGGQEVPGRADTSDTWVGEDRAYVVSEGLINIVRLDKDSLYLVNPNSKTYAAMELSALADLDNLLMELGQGDDDFEKIKSEFEATGSSPTLDSLEAEWAKDEATAMMSATVGEMVRGLFSKDEAMMSAMVTPTDETQVINGYNTKRYNYTLNIKLLGGGITGEIWAAEDIEIVNETYYRASMGMMGGWTGYDQVIEEYKKIKGLGILTTGKMTMMGMTLDTATEVIEHKEADAPEGLYEIPAGYTEVDFEQMSNPHR
jgi:hypothetical protein